MHMRDRGVVKSEREDEDKILIGYSSASMAKQAFLQHYPADFYESMTAMPVAEFKKRLAETQQPYTHNKLHARGVAE